MKFLKWLKKQDSSEQISILDENGNSKKYTKCRSADLEKEEFAQVVHVWIKNSDGKFLVQQRAVSKTVDPLLWSITSGFVSADESCLDTVRRELKEELNLEVDFSKLKKIKSFIPKEGYNHIADIYILETDIKPEDLVLQKEEVNAVSLWSKEEIKNNIKNKKFYDFSQAYQDYFNYIF